MDLTNITRNIGNTIARLKQNNTLIDELRNQYNNPTFLEILEDAKENNGILAAMLMLWYDQKYPDTLSDTNDIDKMINYLKNKKAKETKSKKKPHYVLESGCGNTSGWLYSGGCGSSDYINDSGCSGGSGYMSGC